VAAFGAGLAILLNAPPLLEPCGNAGTAFAQQPETSNSLKGENDALQLEAGKPIEREMAGGQKHCYKIALEAGQYLHLVVDQRSIDVIVMLFGPDDKRIFKMDSPTGTQGPEPVFAIAETLGTYRLEVQSPDKDASAGRYEVKVTDLRMATSQDRNLVLAESAFAEGMDLESKMTAESRRKAIAKHEEALGLFRLADDRQGEGATLHRLGSIYYSLGDNKKALDYLNQSLPLRRAAGDREGEADTLDKIGSVYSALGEKQKALEYYNQALLLKAAIGNRGSEAVTLNNLGLVYYSLGATQKALDYYNQALSLRRAVGDRKGEATTLNNLGSVYNSLGDKQEALDRYSQALSLLRNVGDRRGEAVTLNNLGSVYNSLGEMQNALDHLNRALSLMQTVGDRRGEAATLNSLGSVYYSLGATQKALDYYNQALPLRRAVGDRRGEAYTLDALGLVYNLLGDSKEALVYHKQALSLMRSVGDRRGEAHTLNYIGSVYNSLGDKQGALDYYNQALSLRQAVDDREGETHTLNHLGSVYNLLGERQKALDCHNRALPLARDVGDRNSEAMALFGIARVEDAEGKLLDARNTIESALKILDSLRTKVVSPELRSSYLEASKKYYEFSIDLLMRLHKLRPDERYDRAALQTAERARARSLLERLAEARLEIRNGADPALVERERSLRQTLNAKTERQMRLLNGKHTAEQAAEVANEIKALTAQYQDVEAQIRAKSPRYAALTQPRPLNPEEIQGQTLDDRTLLLEYFLGGERSYLWVVSASWVKSYELPKRADIEEAALLVKKLITARATREEGESLERRRARMTEAEARYWPEAARLSRMILGPAISELSGKRLAIVSDGELQDVAFGALPIPLAAGDSKASRSENWLPLIVEHEIVSLPSASALAVLRKETAGRRPAAKTLAVLADPVFDKDDERIKLAVVGRTEKESGSEAGAPINSELTRAIEEALGARGEISRLPFSRAEAEAILSVAPKAGTLRALDFNASRATATSAELSQYRIVHFATHGLLNRTHPELSGVVLSLVDRHGKPQDGFLQLHDVYNLDLPAELVVLSACRTGLGKAVWGEGLVGLSRGFMYAGAKRVVASLWGVQDLATAELMKRFYGAMLREKRMGPSEALRAAQVEMWRSSRWRSPYYWGGFVLYGEW
jgi:CHAT domain-containing protein/predicted negative regulator of RcsB-dependent stress response